jgi:hypothetical protein
MGLFGLASRREVGDVIGGIGDWAEAGCEVRISTRGWGWFARHDVVLLHRADSDSECDGWMVRGLMMAELAAAVRGWRNVSYRPQHF